MYIAPMLLEAAEKPFDSADHIFEPKIDGHRMIYARVNGETRLYTRHGEEITEKFPELLEGIEDDVVLDGEVAAADPRTGIVCSEAVNERLSLDRPEEIKASVAANPVVFVAFDIVQHRGKDLRMLPLIRRKDILAGLHRQNPNLAIIPYLERYGIALFEAAKAAKLEGIVAKLKMSRYSTGRRVKKWQKVVDWTYVEVVITGYRKSEFGWLAAIPNGDELQPAGIIEVGVSAAHKKAFYEVCRSLESGSYKDIVHLEPKLRAKIKTRPLTRSGKLRDPVFVDFIA